MAAEIFAETETDPFSRACLQEVWEYSWDHDRLERQFLRYLMAGNYRGGAFLNAVLISQDFVLLARYEYGEDDFGGKDWKELLCEPQRGWFGVEHSAKDAYMFLIQADGKNVLYTGDFRASEKAVSAVRELLGEGQKLDLLITVGTNVRPDKQERAGEFQGEEWVKHRAAGRMLLYQGTVFVLCSSANEDGKGTGISVQHIFSKK